MIILDNFKLATIALANFPTGGTIGTAATTVDVASSFTINQTTAGQAVTLPNPSNAIAGDQISVMNIGTASVTIFGKVITTGQFAEFLWTGTAYSVEGDAGRNQGAAVTLSALVAGNNTVTHNLAMPTGQFSLVNLDVRDALGSSVALRRVILSDTTNTIVVSSPIAIATNTIFYITPIA